MFGQGRLAAMVKLVLFLTLAQVFVGSLVSGVGHGFDLGTEWPSGPGKVLNALLMGSLEPVHRLLSVALGIAYVALLALATRHWASLTMGTKASLALSLASLLTTVWTGRLVLLALGSEIPQPQASLVYPINYLFATLTILSMATALHLISGSKGDVVGGLAKVLARGAAAWGLITALLGSLMLGSVKTGLFGFEVPYFTAYITEGFPTNALAPSMDTLWVLHGSSALVAIALTTSSWLLSTRRGKPSAWATVALATAIAQLPLGYWLYQSTYIDPERPGPLLAIHSLFAQLVILGNYMHYLRLGGLVDIEKFVVGMGRLVGLGKVRQVIK